MDSAGQLDRELIRVRIVLLGLLGAFVLLGAALWRIQVLHTSKYRSSLDRQSMRRVRLPGARGALFDRGGVCLANNRPSYSVAIYLEELRSPGRVSNTVTAAERVIDGLSSALKLERNVAREEIAQHMRRRCPLPLLAWQDLDERAMARWAEGSVPFPGADIYVEPVRVYPQGGLASHLIGYVGRLDPDVDEFYHFYLPEMEGRSGLERALNETLAGVAGGRLIRVDALGFKHDEVGERDPIAGEDVVLTIDARIQRCVEEALAGRRGAAAVIDPRNGDILAMASAPAFDPKALRSQTAYSCLTNDPAKPLLNRAVAEHYPPGSTFKPIVALAALESGRAAAGTTFDCPGYFEVGGIVFRCWNRQGHGTLAMHRAIAQSCNAYFCQLGLQCGYDRIHEMAEAFGMGQATGIEMGGEERGLLPDAEWKTRARGEGWRKGDTCNLSIGQGDLLATPLQMAVVAATLGNGGYLYRPRLVRSRAQRPAGRYVYALPNGPVDSPGRDPGEGPDTPGSLVRRIRASPESFAVVRGGMHDVVQAEDGTGKRARVPGVPMGGKTGSAEHGPRAARKTYGWMIAFAPFERPRYAIALVIEDAVSGGATAAPRVGYVMAKIFGVQTAVVTQRDDGEPFGAGD